MKRFATYRQWQNKSVSKVLPQEPTGVALWEFSCEDCGGSSLTETETDVMDVLAKHNCLRVPA